MSDRNTFAWTVATIMVGVAILLVAFFSYVRNRKSVELRGAVMTQDADPRKELPLADVEITAAGGLAISSVKSDSSGFFSIRIQKGIRRRTPVTLQFRRADYKPLDVSAVVGDRLYIAQMEPLTRKGNEVENHQGVTVGNVRVRYSIKTTQDVNIGSAVRVFEVVNAGNVACKGQWPCSPDGKWKAGIGSVALDAGAGNEFRDARVSCIAGPCPFSKIEADGFSKGGQTIAASAIDWSETTTFLLEAEVFHKMASEVIHESYPVIFGRALNFTVPIGAEGISIEADIPSETLIFPLGPALFLSWADCNARVNHDQTSVYRCELKPGYRFQS